jgi:hypothetical protein
MSDFVEWNPKHHGHKPPYWKPDMLASVDGKNFVLQTNWAWIAGSTYYVPHEAVEAPTASAKIITTETPPDWVLLEAAKRAHIGAQTVEYLRRIYRHGGGFTALCDMIEKYEKQP